MGEEILGHNTECRSENHDQHLCYLTSQGFHLSNPDDFQALTNDPEYKCQHCGRKANSNQNLCVPASMSNQ